MFEFLKKAADAKRTAETGGKVSEMVRDFFSNFRTMSSKERAKAIGKIIFAAALGGYVAKLASAKDNQQTPEAEAAAETPREIKAEDEEGKAPEIDPNLVGEIPKDKTPVCRRTNRIQDVAADHRHNAGLLEISADKQKDLNTVLEKYKASKAKYDKVAQATNIPGMLICALHYREAGCNFTTYLHNGQKLGKPTTYVPAGILFKKDDWEKAAIHALGGDIKDENGKPSLKTFQDLRNELGLTADSKDMGAMMAFAERYNGMGYRYRGIRSCYVYAGTNLNQPGRYVADHKFDPKSVDQRLGTAAIVMGIEAMEAKQPLRVAGNQQNPVNPPA